jgi:CheY-like chemotaxis protein
VIEDDTGLREGMQELLALSNPDDEFIFTVDYDAAVKALGQPNKIPQSKAFDFIISDFDFPGENRWSIGGVDIFNYRNDYCPQTPFIFCSGRNRDDIVAAISNSELLDDVVYKTEIYDDQFVTNLKKKFCREPVCPSGSEVIEIMKCEL